MRGNALRSRWLWLIVGAAVILAAAASLIVVHEIRAAQQAQADLTLVGKAIYNRCQDSEGRFTLPPSASEVTPEALSSYLPSGQPWPTNPYNGEPMRQGSGPGDIRYSTGMEGHLPYFELDTHYRWGWHVPGLRWYLPSPGQKAGAADGPTPTTSPSPLPGAEAQ